MYKIIDLQIKGDYRGSLIAIEENVNIPFSIKRIYYIFDTKHGVTRGQHAHINLKQLLIAVNGSCTVSLDDGKNKGCVKLNSPSSGLFIEKMLWREMYDFSNDCVLLVLANKEYSESDYLRNYSEFLKYVNNV